MLAIVNEDRGCVEGAFATQLLTSEDYPAMSRESTCPGPFHSRQVVPGNESERDEITSSEDKRFPYQGRSRTVLRTFLPPQCWVSQI